jgi:radical SAM superfamily enzyme YgiQ (UPF0313 family)
VRADAGNNTIGLRDLTFNEPLELEYLAAALTGHNVKFADMQLHQDLYSILKSYNPDVVGFSGYITSVKNIKKYAEEVKNHNPKTLTVTGGIHATAYPQDFFNHNIDMIVTGEGVDTFNKIVVHSSEIDQITNIKGVYIKEKDNKYFFTGIPSFLKDLDSLPLPDRSLTDSYRNNYYYLFFKPVALVRSSISCSHRCSFCICHKDNQGMYIARDIKKFIFELKNICEPNIYIIDNDFMVNRERLLEFCQRCKTEGLKKNFVCFGRSDFIANNPDVIEHLSEIGLKYVIVGYEFIDQSGLKKMRKYHSIDDNIESVKVLRRFGIEPLASFIIPVDCDESYFQHLIDFIYKNRINYIVIQTLTPLPGTELFDELSANLITQDRDLFDMSHMIVPYKIGSKKVYRGIREVYIKTILNFKRILIQYLESTNKNIDMGIHSKRLLVGGFKYLIDLKKAENII